MSAPDTALVSIPPELEMFVTIRAPDRERTIVFPDGSTVEVSGAFAAPAVGKTRGVRP